jgi:hypothetical protein
MMIANQNDSNWTRKDVMATGKDTIYHVDLTRLHDQLLALNVNFAGGHITVSLRR